jgi:hypothetical protein
MMSLMFASSFLVLETHECSIPRIQIIMYYHIFISRYSEGHKLHTEVLVRMTHAPLDYRASAPVPCKGKQRAPNQTARSTSTTGYASGSHSIDRSMTLPLPSRIPPTPTRIKQAKRNEIVETGADADADAGGGPGAGRKQLHVWRGGPPLR